MSKTNHYSINALSSTDLINFDTSPCEPTTSGVRRHSSRHRLNLQTSTRTCSLKGTIFDTNAHADRAASQLDTDNATPEPPSTPDKLVLATTTTTTSPKSSYWTITDRQAEWFKLTTPIQSPVPNTAVPCRTLSNIVYRKKSRCNQKNTTDSNSDTTQLIMKAVMHELDYNLDDADVQFLAQLNRSKRAKRKAPISEEQLENAIIILEFSTAEKIRAALQQKSCDDDDATVCDICLLPDADDDNAMVFCERCHTCVHQHCYGICDVPTGKWLCRSCSILRRPNCILCPKSGGPMKPTSSGTVWCHLTCALWLPELKFVDYARMEPICNLHQISHARWSLRCTVCSTLDGACVQCAHKNCRTPFHVTCGLAAGYFLDIQQTPDNDPSGSRSHFNAYCEKHSDEARQRAKSDPSQSISSSDDDSSSSSSGLSSAIPLTVYRRDQLKQEKWIPDCLARFSTFVSASHLHEQSTQDFDASISEQIYQYWIRKRQMNRTMPLIERIDYVLEQRDNAELLTLQIDRCLEIRRAMLHLQARCKSTWDTCSSSTLTQRLQSLKTLLSSSSSSSSRSEGDARHRRRRLRSTSQSLHGRNEHGNENQISPLKRRRRNVAYSCALRETKETTKRCRVTLESTYRHTLELNTTYLVGKTREGHMILLPKHLIEHANLITFLDQDVLRKQQQHNNRLPPIEYSDVSDDDDDDDDDDTRHAARRVNTARTAYTSQGNIVTCMTGSFD